MKKIALWMLMLTTTLCTLFPLCGQTEYKLPVRLLSENKVSISLMAAMHALQTDVESQTYLKWLEEATNVQLDATFIAAGQFNEKKNMALASGELADITLGVTAADVTVYGPQGYFLPIDAYWSEEWTPNLWKLYHENPSYKAYATAADGHMYIVPTINELPFRESPINMFINVEWLAKLGLQKPTTYDELYNVLVAFKNQDPNGNGVADEIPLAGNWAGGTGYYRWQSLFSGYGYPVEKDMLYVTDDDQVAFAPLGEHFAEALAFFRKLYGEGLLDIETFTQGDSEYTAKGNKGIYGLYFEWFGNPTVGAAYFEQYEVLAPLQGPYARLWPNLGTRGFSGTSGAAISAYAKDPVLCLRYIDYLMGDEVSMQTSRGPIDIVLYEGADGLYRSFDAPDGMSDDEFRVTNAPAEALPFALMRETVAKIVLPDSFQRKSTVYFPVNEPYLAKKFLPALNFTAEENERLSVLRTDITTYIDIMIPAFITGQESIEKGYEGFLNQLERIGIDEYLSIHQKAYDNYLKAME